MEEVEIQQYIVALEELSPMPSDEALENDPKRIDRYADILHDLKKPRETEGDLIAALWKL